MFPWRGASQLTTIRPSLLKLKSLLYNLNERMKGMLREIIGNELAYASSALLEWISYKFIQRRWNVWALSRLYIMLSTACVQEKDPVSESFPSYLQHSSTITYFPWLGGQKSGGLVVFIWCSHCKKPSRRFGWKPWQNVWYTIKRDQR